MTDDEKAMADTASQSPVRHEVTVRRAPRLGVFVLLGVVAGAIAAPVLAAVNPSPDYAFAASAGFLFVLFGGLGAMLGATAWVLIDRRSARRAVRGVAEERRIPPPESRRGDADRADGEESAGDGPARA